MAFPEITGGNTDEIQLPWLYRKTREPGMTNTPYRDSTAHVIFEPVDFIVRLADSHRSGTPQMRGCLYPGNGNFRPLRHSELHHLPPRCQ
jgi:hypothetical protein